MKKLLFLLLFISCYGGIENQYRTLPFKLGSSGVRNIDYTYLINLDQRPERWQNCMQQLLPYGIIPERFSGIYGWSLSPEALHEMGLKFQHGMWTGKETVMHFPLDGNGSRQWLFLSGAFYGKACFSGWTVIGTLGCTLSHLSVMKDAYDSGYNTIWIMEDDIVIKKNPHQLAELIEELDLLVGPNGWDLLYTDFDYMNVDKTKDVSSILPYYWRPDMPYFNPQILVDHQDINENFMKIGCRLRAHSIIYRRCGLEKILNFYREHDNFLPYDNEVAMIPGIRMFVVKKDVVSFLEVTSDTKYKNFQK